MPLRGLKHMEIKLSVSKTGKVIFSTDFVSDYKTDTGIQKKEGLITEPEYRISLSEKQFEGVYINSFNITVAAAEEFILQTSEQLICYIFGMDGEASFYQPDEVSKSLERTDIPQSHPSDQYAQINIRVIKSAAFKLIQLTPDYYHRITNQEPQGKSLTYVDEKIPYEAKALLHQLGNYGFTGKAERIYLEAKIMELLLVFAEPKGKQVAGIKPDDVEKILLARKIVEDNLQKPFSLIELSRRAGINDFKLKKGFKALTGFTVFGYLYKLRMEKAHFYLKQERRQVNEVSFLVGYKNPQHFITAFKRHFNLLPGSLNKS